MLIIFITKKSTSALPPYWWQSSSSRWRGGGGRRSGHTLSGVFLLECHWPAVGMEPGQLFYSYSLHTNTTTTILMLLFLPPLKFYHEPIETNRTIHYFPHVHTHFYHTTTTTTTSHYTTTIPQKRQHQYTVHSAPYISQPPQAYISPFRRIFWRGCWSE